MPRRFIDHGYPEDGAWGRWARFVLRRQRHARECDASDVIADMRGQPRTSAADAIMQARMKRAKQAQ
jgi:hypothetical protein